MNIKINNPKDINKPVIDIQFIYYKNSERFIQIN